MSSTKFLILALSLTIAHGEELKLKFFEKNNYYEEKITVDKSTLEYQVPKHGNLEESEYLYDYDSRLVVIKRVAAKKCFVYNMPDDMYKPEEVELGVKKYNNKFPQDKFNVENEFMLPLEYLNVTNLPPKVKDFCLKSTIRRVEVYKSNAELEANAYKTLLVSSGGRQKRSESYHSCTSGSRLAIKSCRERNPPKLPTGKNCQYKASGCIYVVKCKKVGQMSFDCPEPPRHLYNWDLACCDFTC